VMINTFAGPVHLARDYRSRVLPALQHLQADPNKVIAVSHQFVAQELEVLLETRVVVMVDGTDAFRLLAQALDAQGITRFTYVCLSNRVMPGEMPVTTAHGLKRIVAAPPVKRGWFLIYDTTILS